MNEILQELYSYCPPFEDSWFAKETSYQNAEHQLKQKCDLLYLALDSRGRSLFREAMAAYDEIETSKMQYAFHEGLRIALQYVQSAPPRA